MGVVERSIVDVAVPLVDQGNLLVEVTVSLLHITRIEPIVGSPGAHPAESDPG
jgi:hypothetical protein